MPADATAEPAAPGLVPASPAPVPPGRTHVSVFEPQWPGPGRIAPRRAVVGAAVAAVVAAATLTWDRPGLGWLATAVVATAAVLVVARPDARADRTGSSDETVGPVDPPRRDRPIRVAWAVLGLALVSIGAVRAAPWLWWLCLPTACLCGTLALSGGRSMGALLQGVLAFPFAIVRATPWGLRGASAARSATTSSVARTVAAIMAGAALLLVFGSLLSSADPAFAKVLAAVLPTVDSASVTRWIINAVLVGVGTLAGCFLALRPPAYDKDAQPDRRGLRRIEWIIPIGALVVLFASFVAVEATVLFGGGAHVLRTAGLTYAEYARQGFWQLLAVTALTLVVIAVAARLAAKRTVADRLSVRLVLGALCLLTLVIVGSALSRMWAYEQAYGFTRLRLLVSVCEGWLGLVFVLIMAAGVRLRGRWLPLVAAQLAALALVGIAVADPDRLIAAQNITRYQDSHQIDLAYLSNLSADAAPAFATLAGDQRRCLLNAIADDLEEQGPDTWRQWNYGRQRARAVLALYPRHDSLRERSCWLVLYGSQL